jgi:hypothetical protein
MYERTSDTFPVNNKISGRESLDVDFIYLNGCNIYVCTDYLRTAAKEA